MLHAVVHGIQIKIHLAGIFRLERADFQINDDEASQLEVIEQEVDVEIVVTDFHVNLPTHEGEAGAEFHEKILKVAEQTGFEFALVEGLFQGEEIEDVGIFQELGREVGLRRWQGALEIGDGLAVPFVGAALDLERQNIAAPAVLEGLPRIPEARGQVFHFLDENDVVRPGQLGNGPLPNLGVGGFGG